MDDATLAALRELTVGDALGALPAPVQAGLAALMVAAAGWALLRPRALPVAGFLAAGFVADRANQAFEGPLLVRFSDDHGLVLADLLPAALLALVACRLLSARSHRGRGARDGVRSGYRASHGTLRVRLRPAPVAAPPLPRGAPGHRSG